MWVQDAKEVFSDTVQLEQTWQASLPWEPKASLGGMVVLKYIHKPFEVPLFKR